MSKSTFFYFMRVTYLLICSIFYLSTSFLYCQSTTFFSGGNICQTEPWKLVYYDEFNGNSIDLNKWYRYYPYGPNSTDQCEDCRTHGSNENQIFLDKNVVVSNGTLKLISKKETISWFTATRNYTSGMIHSKINNFKYGKYEIRCRIPSGAGFWPAFWTFGGGYEIDVFEFDGKIPNKIYTNYHQWFSNYSKNDSKTFIGSDYSQSFHTYTLEWDNFFIKWYIDGSLIRAESKLYTLASTPVTSCNAAAGTYVVNPLFPVGEQSVICDLALGTKSTFVSAPDATTVFPNQMEIDYIRIYQRTPQTGFSDLCQINGSSTICNGGQYTYQFSDTNNPVSSWNVSTNLTIVNSSSSAITVKVNSAYNSTAQITANFLSGNPCGVLVTKNINISAGIEGTISSSVYNGAMQTTNNIGSSTATVNVSIPGSSTFSWVKTSGSGSYYISNNGQTISLSNLGSLSLNLSTNTSTCGTLTRTVAFYNYSSFYSVYPNPASSTINVATKENEATIDYIDEDGKKIDKHIKVAVESLTIYDESGNNLKNVDFQKNNKNGSIDIKQLRPGIYYLEIANDEYRFKQKIIKQ